MQSFYSNYGHQSGIPVNWDGRVYGLPVDPVIVIIALLVSFYFKGCTHTSNESYAFNLGRAILWPITLINGH